MLVDFAGRSPEIADSAWIAPTATLVGGVRIAERASVFFGAVVRADGDEIEIGADSNLQDNVTVHCDPGKPARIGRGVSVGHNAVLHGCTIEDDCLVGMGATVLNTAVVGTCSLVAAGALVLEGTVVPPRSLVAGVPARVRRELTDAEVEGLRRNARAYLELSAVYASAEHGLPSTQGPDRR